MDGVYLHCIPFSSATFDEMERNTSSGNSGRQACNLTSMLEYQKMQQPSQMQMPQQQHINAPEIQFFSELGMLPVAQIPSPIVVSNAVIYGPYEQFAKCQRCNKQIRTRIENQNNYTALCLFNFGCILIFLGVILIWCIMIRGSDIKVG